MTNSEFVSALCGKPSIDQVGKGDMVQLICRQYEAINELGLELYCADPTHPRFAGMREQDLREFKAEWLRRNKDKVTVV